jgi:hypothetical protein
MLDYIQHMWNLDLGDDRQGVWFWGAVNAFLICGYSILFQLIIRSCPSTRGQLNHLGLDKFGAAIICLIRITTQMHSSPIKSNSTSIMENVWIIIASHNVQFILKHQLSKVETCPDNSAKRQIT